MTRWLITGAGGMLGSELVRALGEEATGCTRGELDITDGAAVRQAVAGHDVVVNAAAWTDVDGAEAHEEEAFDANARGPVVLANACLDAGVRLVHVSTDYVFAGDGDRPYREDDPVGPRSVYGRSKLAGERFVTGSGASAYIVRSSWLYGSAGSNFVTTMARLAAERETVDVVSDQRGSPTSAADLAAALIALGRSDAPPGTYHCTNTGDTTWFGLARAVFSGLGLDPERVLPTTTAAVGRPAPRPAYSVLDPSRWRAVGLPPMRSWQQALQQHLGERAAGHG